MPVVVIGRLATGRLAVLPFAPVLWLYAWAALSLVKHRMRTRSQLLISGQILIVTAGFVGILYAQSEVYSRITRIWVPAKDNYFFVLFIAETIVMILVIFRLAYKERRRETLGGSG